MIDGMLQDSIDQTLDDRQQRPVAPPRQQSGFSLWNTIKAPVVGAAAGGVEAGGFGADVLGAFGQVQAAYGAQADPSLLLLPDEMSERRAAGDDARQQVASGEAFSSTVGTGLRTTARGMMPDPATSNAVEQTLFQLGRFGGKAVGYSLLAGPAVGAALTAGDEGMTEADRLKAEGVDIGTRTQVGAVAGAAAGLGVALPVAGRTIAQTAALVVAGGPGAYIAQQAASREILKNADYTKVADQYDPFDPVGLAVSTLVPAGFGAWAARGMHGAAKPAPAGDAAAASRALVDMGGAERKALPYNDPRLDAYAVTAAQREGIPPEALLAIKNVGERSKSSAATSPVGAKGIMQFMDSTWTAYGKGDVRDPVANIDGAARYMKDLIQQYGGDVRAAIAHYNGGGKAGEAVRAGKAPPAAETRAYLERTDRFMAEHAGEAAGRAAAGDPDAVAAARTQLIRDTVDSWNLHPADDLAGSNDHLRALVRASDQLGAGERVDVSDIIGAERLDIGRAYDAVRSLPGGDRFDPMVMIRPEDMDAVAISRGGWKNLGDMEVKGSGYGLVKFIWRHGEESTKAPEFQVTRDDLMAFPQIIRDFEPSRAADDSGQRGREWRVSLPDASGRERTVVFAENKVNGSDVRQMVSLHVQEPGRPGADAPMSQRKTDLPSESPGKRLDARTGDTQPALLQQDGQGKSVEASIAEPGETGGAPAGAESKANAAAMAGIDAQAAEIAKLSPDMMVQLEGMDAPVRVADALEAIRREAEAEAADASLIQAAAECFLRNT